MDLFLDEEIDEVATRKNVKKFFEKIFPRLVMLSGLDSTQLKSPIVTDMPTNKTVENSNEEKIINMLEAQRIVKEVIKSMKCVRGHGSTILFDIYVLEASNVKTAMKIGFGQANYYRLKRKALLDFADAFMYEKDFHVYK